MTLYDPYSQINSFLGIFDFWILLERAQNGGPNTKQGPKKWAKPQGKKGKWGAIGGTKWNHEPVAKTAAA